MFHNPIIWVEKFQITADSIQFLVCNNEIRKMYLASKPIIINKQDSIDFNQIKGKKMVGQFKANKLYKMDVSGNGQSIFLVKDDSEKKIGINNTYCTDLTLYFEKNKLENINYQKKPNSKTIPYNEITEEDQYLRGFIWREKERPKSKLDILIE